MPASASGPTSSPVRIRGHRSSTRRSRGRSEQADCSLPWLRPTSASLRGGFCRKTGPTGPGHSSIPKLRTRACQELQGRAHGECTFPSISARKRSQGTPTPPLQSRWLLFVRIRFCAHHPRTTVTHCAARKRRDGCIPRFRSTLQAFTPSWIARFRSVPACSDASTFPASPCFLGDPCTAPRLGGSHSPRGAWPNPGTS